MIFADLHCGRTQRHKPKAQRRRKVGTPLQLVCAYMSKHVPGEAHLLWLCRAMRRARNQGSYGYLFAHHLLSNTYRIKVTRLARSCTDISRTSRCATRVILGKRDTVKDGGAICQVTAYCPGTGVLFSAATSWRKRALR